MNNTVKSWVSIGCVIGVLVACTDDEDDSEPELAGEVKGGTAGGGMPGGGTAGGGMAGGGMAGGGAQVWTCPAGPFETVTTNVTPTRVAGVPPMDGFNDNNWGNIEGPVWIGDALYLSEIGSGPNPPKSRVLKVTSAGVVSIAIEDSGSNGLATNLAGELLAGVHKDGSISKLSLTGGAALALVDTYMGSRLDSPNDLAIRSDGVIYFSDPDWQAPEQKPQAKTRLYRLPAGASEAIAIDDTLEQPNGVTLSLDEKTLYVSGGQLKKYPVQADGSVGLAADFVTDGSGDGMVIDCAGNLYVTSEKVVKVYTPQGDLIGQISVEGLGMDAPTNVAFGGPERKTLYITGYGVNRGLAKVAMNVPGLPY